MLAVLPSMGVEGPGGGRAAAAGELEGPAGGRVAAAGDELAMALAWRTEGVDSHSHTADFGTVVLSSSRQEYESRKVCTIEYSTVSARALAWRTEGVDSNRAYFHAGRVISGAVVLTSEGQERLLSIFDFVFSRPFLVYFTDYGRVQRANPVYAHSQSHLFLSFLITVR